MLKRLKKVLSVFVILALVLSSGIIVHADYPIFYQRYTADPSGLEANGRIYLYCSHDVYNPSSPGYIMNDITCISTDDLKNWTDHGEVFKASGWASMSWAPVVVARNNKYYMYYGNSGSAIGVAVSSSPEGPFTDALGKALVNGSTPGVNPPSGFWCFDPGAFVDDDGQAYLYFGGNGQGNTRVIKLNSDMISVNGSASQIVAPIFMEDSWIHKYNGKYYYSYSTDFSKGSATINYMMSSSPTTGFVDKGTVLANPPQNEGNNNHHSIFSYKGNWYIAYHNRALAIANGQPAGDARTYQRSVCLDQLYYNTDGTMKQVTMTTNGLPQLKYVNPYTTNEAETMAQESGINTESCSEGGRDVCNIENGDWTMIKGVDFGTGATSFDARVASATSGGNIEIRLDSATGTLVGTCAVSGTGGWQTWTTKSCTVSGATGTHNLYLKFTGGSGSLLNLNWYKFNSGSATPTPTPTPSVATATPTPTPSVATATPTPGPQSAFSQIEAESYNTQSGIQTESCTEGGQDVGYIENGDYTVYNNIDFGSGAASFQARVASATSGGNIEIRLDSTTGPLVGTCPVAGTGDWQTWTASTCSVSGASGMHDLYLKFTGGSGYLFNLNWFKFTGGSATSTPTPTPVSTATPTPSATATSTPTPDAATATPTPTPTTGTPVPGGIKVQFFNGNTAAATNTIYPNFKLVNTGTAAINLSDVKMRYYFTNDGTQADSFACDYSTIGSGNVTGAFATIAKTNADRYLEVGFTSAAGTLAAGGSAEVKGRIWKSDWSNFTQTGDYSFNATATNYVDSTTVTGYLTGALKWGTEP